MTAEITIYPTAKAAEAFAKRTQAKMTAALGKVYREMYPDKSDAEIAAVVEETIRESEPTYAEMAAEEVRRHAPDDAPNAEATGRVDDDAQTKAEIAHEIAYGKTIDRLATLRTLVGHNRDWFKAEGAVEWGWVGSLQKVNAMLDEIIEFAHFPGCNPERGDR